MREYLTLSLFAASAMCALPPALLATVIPPNLPAGSQYQLVFVTAGTRDATSWDVADYNTFVAHQASFSATLPTTTWHAIVSTATNPIIGHLGVIASVNAPSGGLPVFNTDGFEVALATTGIYTSSLLNAIAYDQYGNDDFSAEPWTGTTFLGNAAATPIHTQATLGNLDSGSVPWDFPVATIGAASATTGAWAAQLNDDGYIHYPNPTPALRPIYALSDPITVPVPEPRSAVMFVLGFLGLADAQRRRKNY